MGDDFSIGAKVDKRFGKRWYVGTVDQLMKDEGTTVWNVTWSDFDSEEVDLQQLTQILCYHPFLDTYGGVSVPEVGSFVWYSYSDRQEPQLGRVCEVDPTAVRPVVVQLYVPARGAPDITKARFALVADPENNSPILRRLTLPQIVLRFSCLTAKGHLKPKDRALLAKRIF